MNLEVGKKYKTRSGLKAFVFSMRGRDQEAIGYIELPNNDGDVAAEWFSDGTYYMDKREAGSDIVAEWTDTPEPGEGWRLLDVGERLEEGDQFYNSVADWVGVCLTWSGGVVQKGSVYRRRIAPQYVPYTWDDREELRGRWYRQKEYPEHETLVAHLEISRNEIGINGWGAPKFLQDCEWLDGTPCGKKSE
jgi:hypothetical protein